MKTLVPKPRLYHMAALIKQDGSGGVSALCFARPTSIDMRKRVTWTTSPDAVTCPKCKEKMKEREAV